MTDVTTRQLLRRAADRIEQYGHTKGHYFKGIDPQADLVPHLTALDLLGEGDNRPCCVYGALYYEAAVADLIGARLRVAEAANHLAKVLNVDVIDWNDKPSQRKARVVAALRKAAEQEGK